jgi:hypothetical protein
VMLQRPQVDVCNVIVRRVIRRHAANGREVQRRFCARLNTVTSVSFGSRS